tara:strand:+ start:376 stop:951 length:576 start_codon:yes stop_codon:yes gene_type:complete
MTQYYSKTKDETVNINDMHHQHVWYAFKKLCDRLEELGICEHIWEDDYNVTTFKKKDYVRKDVYELLFDKCQRLEENSNSKSVFKLEKEISKLREFVALQDKTIDRLLNDQKHIGHRYVFSNIPNTEEGRQIVYKLRRWLNKDTYNMRVRGQYLDKTKLSEGESWRTYDDGQPLSKSRCIRLYIDKKRESA